MDIKISIIDISYANTAPIPKTLMVSFFINEKLNKNAKVEKLTKAREKCTPYRYKSFIFALSYFPLCNSYVNHVCSISLIFVFFSVKILILTLQRHLLLEAFVL